jgi:hypothetical protein
MLSNRVVAATEVALGVRDRNYPVAAIDVAVTGDLANRLACLDVAVFPESVAMTPAQLNIQSRPVASRRGTCRIALPAERTIRHDVADAEVSQQMRVTPAASLRLAGTTFDGTLRWHR